MATAYEWRAINVMFIEHMIMSTDYIPKSIKITFPTRASAN